MDTILGILNVQKLHTTSKHQENRDKPPETRRRGTINSILLAMSTVFPVFVFFTHREDGFDGNILLRFTTLVFPFSYSAAQHFLLLSSNWGSSCRSSSGLYRALCLALNALLAVFFVISICSLILFTADEWDDNEAPTICSMLFPSLLLSSTCLLSISCNFATFQFVDSGPDIPIDLLIFLCLVILHKTSPLEDYEYLPYFAIPSFILVLVRSFKERLLPRKSSPPAAAWRVAVFLLILVLTISVYVFISRVCWAVIESKWEALTSD
ncbi:hypothetical protein M970_110070 [Encephalitozoon cuniculi EcunIII-L]|uniref:Uncharacterized protein n=1 Tax=Encephalitozoon cuniculi TaxID=6035 RepID=M1K6D0_ENCCN